MLWMLDKYLMVVQGKSSFSDNCILGAINAFNYTFPGLLWDIICNSGQQMFSAGGWRRSDETIKITTLFFTVLLFLCGEVQTSFFVVRILR